MYSLSRQVALQEVQDKIEKPFQETVESLEQLSDSLGDFYASDKELEDDIFM